MSATPGPNSPSLIIGPTGSGKTSLLATLFEWIWQQHHKISLFYTCDGGGFTARMQGLVRTGIARAWRMPTRGRAFETLDRATKGYWPSKIRPLTGDTDPDVRLVAPVLTTFEIHCPAGHLLATYSAVTSLSPLACTECKKAIPTTDFRIRQITRRTKGLEAVGGVGFDGFSSAQTWILDNMSERAGRAEIGGEKSALGGIIREGDFISGGNNRAQFGFAQSRAASWAHNLQSIPGLVVSPWATALTNEASDEGGLRVMGPKFAGQAKTDEGPQWFANTLECGVAINDEGHEIRRLWLEQFVDASGVRHLVKHRAGPGRLPPYLDDPYDPEHTGKLALSQFNLGKFQAMLDQAVTAEVSRIEEQYPDAPGLPETEEVEYQVEEAVADATPSVSVRPAAPSGPPVMGAKPGPGQSQPVPATPSSPSPVAPAARAVKAAPPAAKPPKATRAPAPVAGTAPAAPAAAAPAAAAPVPRQAGLPTPTKRPAPPPGAPRVGSAPVRPKVS